jgi:hypothetical protein
MPRKIAPVVLLIALAGCGYSIRPPFNTAKRTVYVPMLKSVTFRRDMNVQMTELLQKEIERRTPFKVVGSPEEADTVLDGTVFMADKNAMVENPNNLPRQVLGLMAVHVRWTDNHTGETKAKNTPPVAVGEFLPFFPELGETTNLAYQKLMARLVQDIVSMMEEPW